MNRLLWSSLLLALSVSQLPADDRKSAPSSAVSLPSGATEVSPGVWRNTEKNGKTYLYRRTPFGLSKLEDSPTPTATQASSPSTVTAAKPEVQAKDLGDNVRFEAKSPFGPRVWQKRKSELTDEEKEWLAKSKAPDAPASQTATIQPVEK